MPARPRIDWRLGALLLAAAAGVAAVCAAPADWLVGAADTDLSQQFLAWRAFAAASLRSGHLPLWNPYTYGGEPFLAGFQSAVFYPPNLLFLLLPIGRAVNLTYLAHLVLLGAGMNRLARQRGFDRRAAFLAGCLLPLSGAVFPHLYAGHLSNLCSLAWTPWILAGLEDWQRRRRPSGLLLAGAAAAVQILAGQVQYVFYTAVAAGLQAIAVTVCRPEARRRALPGLAAAYAGAALLAAVQLFPGLAAGAENLRHAKLAYGFVSIFGFPVENLLTAFAPGFFGDLRYHVYWGRDYLWEMSLFAGVTSLVLAAVGAADRERRRSAWFDLGLAAVLLLLAFGSQTPLFRFLYHYVPGFDRFRGLSKFTFPATIYFLLAAAAGADALVARRLPAAGFTAAALLGGLAALGAGAAIYRHPALIAGLLVHVQGSRESFLPAAIFADRGFARAAAVQAGRATLQAGGVLILVAVLLAAARRRPVWRWALLPILAGEMGRFAAAHFAGFYEWQAMPRMLRGFTASHPGDYRVLDSIRVDNGFLLRSPDIWGNDPALLRRYAEFIAYTQGINPDEATQIVVFHRFPSIYTLLRLRYVFAAAGQGVNWTEYSGALPHILLVSDYRVLPGRDAILSTLSAPGFDPRHTVLLESEPVPRPVSVANPGAVRLLEAGPDYLVIEAALSEPALLLITDSYSRDWHARPLLEGDHHQYSLLPADYIDRALPLGPGYHLFRVEYFPTGFRLGAYVSIAALILWLWAVLKVGRDGSSRRVEPAGRAGPPYPEPP